MKKTKNLSILLTIAATIVIFLSACSKNDNRCTNKNLITQEVPVTGKILGIIIEGPWEVSVTQDSAKNDALIEYPACYEKKITAEVRSNGYLHIKVRGSVQSNHGRFNVTTNVTALEKIDGSGAAIIRTTGRFYFVDEITLSGASTVSELTCNDGSIKLTLSGASTLKNFTFSGVGIDANLSGASKAKISNVTMDYCTVNCSGASTFEGNGDATKTTFTGSGASHFKTLYLVSENLDIDLSGASDAEVTVNNSIKGRLTGASTLKYRNATNVNVDVSGASTITRIN